MWARGSGMAETAGQIECPDCGLACAFKGEGECIFSQLVLHHTWKVLFQISPMFGGHLGLTLLYVYLFTFYVMKSPYSDP